MNPTTKPTARSAFRPVNTGNTNGHKFGQWTRTSEFQTKTTIEHNAQYSNTHTVQWTDWNNHHKSNWNVLLFSANARRFPITDSKSKNSKDEGSENPPGEPQFQTHALRSNFWSRDSPADFTSAPDFYLQLKAETITNGRQIPQIAGNDARFVTTHCFANSWCWSV